MESEQARLTAKLVDLEDRSRRNNIRVRGVPESVAGSDIPEYLRQLFTAIQPSLEPADLRLDRAHRVPKPATLARDIPRDIVTKLHYFSAKDAILTAQRKSTAMPPGYEKISLFADLSPMTMARRRDFINVTKCLSPWLSRPHLCLYNPRHPDGIPSGTAHLTKLTSFNPVNSGGSYTCCAHVIPNTRPSPSLYPYSPPPVTDPLLRAPPHCRDNPLRCYPSPQ
ncbi:Hypothetical predicted protein [Pelobates cultripes]|uniref:Uncharacterized protein n=1 Tax=Pelobates cultripes TaxID=61616 RepID=A0AAD1SY75_PELCU|nr:Hypothetical predicted protein [Pelobates cultripes]